ncbi:MAG: ABC transporter substrate-binding protein [Ruminococcaceae bacterium]|nr:ABC transporter substrate-binding protein [Oscillospiraceae bacterium]
MKKIISLTLALLIFAAAALPSFAEVDVKSGYDYTRFKNDKITLNVYNWGEYISNGNDDSVDVIDEFQKLTGITVNYTTFDTNESLYAKLKSGGGNYDVIIPSDYMIGKMVKEDMLAELDFANIPNASLIGDSYKKSDYDPENKYSVAYMWGLIGIVYNKTMVDEGDLAEGWGLLWDEQYAGQILMFNNSRDAFGITSMLIGSEINPTAQAEIDACAEKLKAQKSVVQAYVMDEIFDKMGGGEAALAPYYAGDGITMMQDNPDLGMFIPQEGSNLYIDAMCIPKTSKNKQAAEMFINFMCETSIALANAEYICYSSPQIEVPALLDEEYSQNPMMYPDEDMLSRCTTYSVLSDEINSAMDLAWSEVRSFDTSGNGWLMPVALVLMLAISIFGFVRKWKKEHRNDY